MQIGDAVNFLHSQKIAHRDLKLQNVMLKKEVDPVTGSTRNVCKLTDMGLASACWKTETGPVFTHAVAGTRHAMAPEIIENDLKKGSVAYNAIPADMWALGVMLYEMLTRAIPFNPSDMRTMLRLQKKRAMAFTIKYDADRRDRTRREPSNEAKHLIRMLFAPDPAARWLWTEVLQHPWIANKAGALGGGSKNHP